ncbi:Hint domain-containing protein [Sulfitobacter sp. S190]|uniref:Hint domain-containing protein n=1 Tax=Sulfitobacter sp. S190 TaxID=2867022 RepID=UPI0021A62C02|nr:Hint domain-containing protein [Sulfitobacter sp. S190]UWR23201.1 Hint domain-containing protein [Sulfitobacter sp. S190]
MQRTIAALPLLPTMGMETMFGWKTKSQPQTRRTVELTGAYDGGLASLSHGLMVGTRVASNLGWRAIDALAKGDMVLTFDHGMQEITEIRRAHVWLDAPDVAEHLWPVVVPVDALGNREELHLLPDQGVMIESDLADDAFGDPFAIVPAHSLCGLRGIRRRQPMRRVELIAVYFAADEVIYAEGGALIHCPRDLSTLDKFLDQAPTTYSVLDADASDAIALDLMQMEAVMAAEAPAPRPRPC